MSGLDVAISLDELAKAALEAETMSALAYVCSVAIELHGVEAMEQTVPVRLGTLIARCADGVS